MVAILPDRKSRENAPQRTARAAARRGLTLIEVMISVFVMCGVLFGALGSVVQAYRMNEDARRQDQVRAILQSYVDDFECGEVRDKTKAVRTFFQISFAPTGDGLTWTDAAGTTTTGTSSGLKFFLGGVNAPEVTITRWVRGMAVSNTTGTPDATASVMSAVGREIVAEFTATYRVNRRTHVVTLTVVRSDV